MSFRTEQADAFSSAFAPANASPADVRNLSSFLRDSPAHFLPGNRRCTCRVQIRNAPRDLLLPGAFRVVIDCCVQAVNQRARQIRPFFLGQAQRLLHYLADSFGHGLSIPRLSVSSSTSSFASRTKITSLRPSRRAPVPLRAPAFVQTRITSCVKSEESCAFSYSSRLNSRPFH